MAEHLPVVESQDKPGGNIEKQTALAFGFTVAIVVFVGAIVVLSIPFAILSVTLPPMVNHLGLNVEATQGLLFGRPGYLLVPAALIGVWAGYKAYQRAL